MPGFGTLTPLADARIPTAWGPCLLLASVPQK
jgi:hypothetical protein